MFEVDMKLHKGTIHYCDMVIDGKKYSLEMTSRGSTSSRRGTPRMQMPTISMALSLKVGKPCTRKHAHALI
eukprot:362995-Chlamydomonas_euryale.AAC.1